MQHLLPAPLLLLLQQRLSSHPQQPVVLQLLPQHTHSSAIFNFALLSILVFQLHPLPHNACRIVNSYAP
jgi:hypothetical protein